MEISELLKELGVASIEALKERLAVDPAAVEKALLAKLGADSVEAVLKQQADRANELDNLRKGMEEFTSKLSATASERDALAQKLARRDFEALVRTEGAKLGLSETKAIQVAAILALQPGAADVAAQFGEFMAKEENAHFKAQVQPQSQDGGARVPTVAKPKSEYDALRAQVTAAPVRQ